MLGLLVLRLKGERAGMRLINGGAGDGVTLRCQTDVVWRSCMGLRARARGWWWREATLDSGRLFLAEFDCLGINHDT